MVAQAKIFEKQWQARVTSHFKAYEIWLSLLQAVLCIISEHFLSSKQKPEGN